MTPVEVAVVRRKLGIMMESLRSLEPIGRFSLEEYRDRLYERKATERLLQEVVEAAVDINTYLTVQLGEPAPEEYYTSFLKLTDLGVLPRELAEELAPSAGLRNRLVHQYDELDDRLVLEAVRSVQELFTRYIRAVEEFLERRESGGSGAEG